MSPQYWVKSNSDVGRSNQLCKEKVGQWHPKEEELLLLAGQKLNMN